jgi:small subunit ribosomal protein S20
LLLNSGDRTLANTIQAKKRVRQSVKAHERNISKMSEMRTYVKNVVKLVAKGELENAQVEFRRAQKRLDSLVSKRLIHKNRASRLKSRLNARIKAAVLKAA